MSRRILSKLVPALALAVWAAVMPAAAADIGNANFTLTFPDGWSKLSIGNDSTLVIAMKGADGGAYMSGYKHQGDLTSAEIAAYMAIYGGKDSMTVTEQGPKTLGGKQFTLLEFKKTVPADSDEAKQRYRIYYYAQGGFLFQAITEFDAGADKGIVADLETALATLKITAPVGLRAVAASLLPESRPADHDVMGRFQRAEIRRIPLFRVPAL